MKKLLLLTALLVSSCCTTCRDDCGLTPEEARKERALAHQMNERIHDELQGEGYFTMDSTEYYGCPPYISDSYSTILYHYTAIEDARNVICRIVKEYLIAYNNDASIRPLFHGGPITPEDLHISVYFYDNNHDTLASPYISRVECNQGQINYYILNDDEVSERVSQEPYEYARDRTPNNAATAKPL